MNTISDASLLIKMEKPGLQNNTQAINKKTLASRTVSGTRQRIVKALIWANIFFISIKIFRKPSVAFRKAIELRQLRNLYRNNHFINKYTTAGGRYFIAYNIPGWPSKAFNRYIHHLFGKVSTTASTTLHTLIFAITKKCGFKCEHCCEWENLNKPDQLKKEDLLLVIQRFHALGVAQVQLSGGEPLNRFNDIIYLLDYAPSGIDFWIYTTGYQLTKQKALLLKQHGLTGITISLDDHDEKRHDTFRGKPGSYQRALLAAQYAVESGIAVTFSLCAVKNFITRENLWKYAELARSSGVANIQILEPKAVGHYAGKEVSLDKNHWQLLEDFYETMNFDNSYKAYPLVAYHGYYSRRIGCAGSGKDYLYVDTDGDVHSCPFCQRKLFSALDSDLNEGITQMKAQGCGVYNFISFKK